MSNINEPDAVMIGFIQLPCGKEGNVSMYGTVKDLMIVLTAVLGLEVDKQQVDQLEHGGTVDKLFFSDGNGSFVTMQPANSASAFLATTS